MDSFQSSHLDQKEKKKVRGKYLPTQSHPSLGDDDDDAGEAWESCERVAKKKITATRTKDQDESLILRGGEKPPRLFFSRLDNTTKSAMSFFISNPNFVWFFHHVFTSPRELTLSECRKKRPCQESFLKKCLVEQTKWTSNLWNVWRPTDVPTASIPPPGRAQEGQRGGGEPRERKGGARSPKRHGQDNTQSKGFFFFFFFEITRAMAPVYYEFLLLLHRLKVINWSEIMQNETHFFPLSLISLKTHLHHFVNNSHVY